MPNFLDHSQFNQTELRRPILENLAAAPTSPTPKAGQVFFNTTLNKQGTFNGTTWDYADSSSVMSVGGTGPIVSSGGLNPVISIVPASGGTAGSMSISDYVKLSAATSANTNNAIVVRDSSGNFAANVVTANLTGTATNASQLNSQAAAYYLARANHTGTQTSGSISDFDAQVRASRLDQMAPPTSNLGFGGNRITGLADPQNPQDAVTKAYADALISTGNNKGTARFASTGTVNLSAPGSAMDGGTLAPGDIVFLKDQINGAENALYVWSGAATALTRTTNADTSAEVKAGLYVFVSEGTLNGNNGYTLTTDDPIALGTTALTFTQTSGAGQIIAGAGVTKTGNQIDVGAGPGIIVNADGIQTDPAIVPTKFAQAIGDGVSAVITVTHGLSTRDVSAYRVTRNSSPWDEVQPSVAFPTINTATVTFSAGNIPTANQYRIAIAA